MTKNRLFFRSTIYMLLTVLLIGSCGPRPIYESTKQIEGKWEYEKALPFDFNISDHSISYDLILKLDYSTSFAYKNLYVKIETEYPDKSKTEDIVSLNLTDRMGAFQGKCNSNSCETDILLKEKFKFKEPGAYTIAISQHSREEKLAGIKEASLMLFERK